MNLWHNQVAMPARKPHRKSKETIEKSGEAKSKEPREWLFPERYGRELHDLLIL